ncbi:MAG: phosphate acyltransferase PlsX [Chloroflexi bacterium]|nr:phosphate acyltransferase PlsX [Chloroflexota bacterium]
MRIVVDAMGSDKRPLPDVEGAILAAREYGVAIILVGDKPRIRQAINQHDTAGLTIETRHAPEEIVMSDKPSHVMKSKPQSSMHIGMMMVKNGEADAFVTMGNTGAVHAIATLSTLRRIAGVKRPALTAIYPVRGQETIFLDVGANADSRADWLEQFAIMGSVYAERALGRHKPRVATLSNGEEEGKGNQLVREVQERLHALTLNYIGHIEPKEILEPRADVIVMDGFVGNIFIKTFEAAIVYLGDVIREEIRANPVSTVGGVLSRGAFRRVRSRIDTRGVGGAPLLGVNGVVIKGHGSSDSFAVKNAIHQAIRAVQGNTVEEIRRGLEQLKTDPQGA